MNVITQKEKQEFREFFEDFTKDGPRTITDMALDLTVSPNYIRRRLKALGRNVVQKLPPEEGLQGRPAARYQVRR